VFPKGPRGQPRGRTTPQAQAWSRCRGLGSACPRALADARILRGLARNWCPPPRGASWAARLGVAGEETPTFRQHYALLFCAHHRPTSLIVALPCARLLPCYDLTAAWDQLIRPYTYPNTPLETVVYATQLATARRDRARSVRGRTVRMPVCRGTLGCEAYVVNSPT
jgi:hypothetical protein